MSSINSDFLEDFSGSQTNLILQNPRVEAIKVVKSWNQSASKKLQNDSNDEKSATNIEPKPAFKVKIKRSSKKSVKQLK